MKQVTKTHACGPDLTAAIEAALEDCGLFTLDADGAVTSWNRGAERLEGLRAEETIGSQYSRFYLPEDVGKGTPARDLQAAAAKGRHMVEGWRIRKDASQYWAEVSLSAMKDSTGAVYGFLGVMADHTRRKQEQEDRERLLKEADSQRRLFQSVMEHAPAAIAIVDGRGLRVRWANPVFLKLVEVQAWGGDISGLRLQAVLQGVDESGLGKAIRAAARSGEAKVFAEYELGAMGPATTYWRTAVVPLGDNSGTAEAMLLMTDVTEQVTYQRKMAALADRSAAQQRFLAIILDTIPVSVTYLDSELVYRQCNAAAAKEFGKPAVEILGRRLDEVMPSNPAVTSALEEVLKTGQPYSEPMIALKWPGRGERQYRVAYLPDVSESGRTAGVFSMRLDITEVIETKRRLEEAIRELELRNREVERANRLKSEFLARMSHELRTPLTSIIGFSELLSEQELTAKQQRQVNHILEGARHLLALISDILDLSKIEAGRMELHTASFTLKDALAEAAATLAPLVAAKRQSFADLTGEGIVLCADRVRFKQILFNLLSNAVKFTPEEGRVWVTSEEIRGLVAITVSDTGVGIPPGELGQIFNEFHQAGATTSGLKEGTGLGLAIARRLVEMHGGEVSVRSVDGEGSHFTFRIPAPGPQ